MYQEREDDESFVWWSGEELAVGGSLRWKRRRGYPCEAVDKGTVAPKIDGIRGRKNLKAGDNGHVAYGV